MGTYSDAYRALHNFMESREVRAFFDVRDVLAKAADAEAYIESATAELDQRTTAAQATLTELNLAVADRRLAIDELNVRLTKTEETRIAAIRERADRESTTLAADLATLRASFDAATVRLADLRDVIAGEERRLATIRADAVEAQQAVNTIHAERRRLVAKLTEG